MIEAFHDISSEVYSDLYPSEAKPKDADILRMWKEIRIPWIQFINRGGACLIRVFGSIYNLLSFVYPGESFQIGNNQFGRSFEVINSFL